MTPKLTTLAIGGPHAGQTLTGSYGALQAAMPEPMRPVADWRDEGPLVTMRINRAIYREEEIRWTGDKGEPVDFKFWVHESIRGGGDAILRELIGGYRPVHVDYTV